MTSSRSSSRNSIGGIEGGKAFPISSGMSLSHWLQSVRSSPLLDYRSTQDLPTTADVVIVGSGMSGTFIAYELLRQPNPPSKVVVLEAREFCSGATGRNSGHCKPDQYRGFVKYAKLFGEEQAKKLLDHEFKTWSKLVEFVEKAKVDCDLWVGDTFDVAMSPEVARDVVAAFDAYKAYGEKSEHGSIFDTAEKTGFGEPLSFSRVQCRTKAYGGKVDHINYISDPAEAEKVSRLKGALAIWSWKASTLFPWKLVAHIMQLCLDKGLHLQTWTPVSSVTTSGNRMWSVHTPRGVIPAPTVVYATNAYTSALLPSFARYIQPTAHMCDKVVPPRAYAGGHALQNSYAVILPAQLGAYTINPRCSADGIVLFDGWDLGRGKLEKYLDEDPRRLFDDSLNGFPAVTEAINELTSTALAGWSEGENAAGVGPVYAWSGIIGLMYTLPFVGAIPDSPGQWVCAGFHGHGMAHIFSCAPGLVTLMQGGSWAETELPECLQLTPERLGRIERKGLHFQP